MVLQDPLYGNKAMLVVNHRRNPNASTVIGEIELRGLSMVPGLEVLENEVEDILIEVAAAAATVVARHLPRLHAISGEMDEAAKDGVRIRRR